jgi:hypothetical protein
LKEIARQGSENAGSLLKKKTDQEAQDSGCDYDECGVKEGTTKAFGSVFGIRLVLRKVWLVLTTKIAGADVLAFAELPGYVVLD